MGILAAASIAVLVLIFVLAYTALRCKHAWEFVDKTEMTSRLEEAKKNGVNLREFWAYQLEEMAQKKVVIVLRCPKCGTPKIYTETN